jgi:hypothetical protein
MAWKYRYKRFTPLVSFRIAGPPRKRESMLTWRRMLSMDSRLRGNDTPGAAFAAIRKRWAKKNRVPENAAFTWKRRPEAAQD